MIIASATATVELLVKKAPTTLSDNLRIISTPSCSIHGMIRL